MIRERIFTISTLLAFVVLSGVAHAEPTLTRKGSEGGPSSQTRWTEPDWYRARAMQEGAPARSNRAGGDKPPDRMPLPVFRRTRRTKKRSPRHMLTLTRSGMGLIRMASRSPQRRVTKHSIEEHHDTSNCQLRCRRVTARSLRAGQPFDSGQQAILARACGSGGRRRGRLQLELAGRRRRRPAPSHAPSVRRHVRPAPLREQRRRWQLYG
jgi:hypothetical protein